MPGGGGGWKCEHVRAVWNFSSSVRAIRQVANKNKGTSSYSFLLKDGEGESLFQPQTLDSEDACEVVVPSVPARVALPRQQSGAQAALGEGALGRGGGTASTPLQRELALALRLNVLMKNVHAYISFILFSYLALMLENSSTF